MSKECIHFLGHSVYLPAFAVLCNGTQKYCVPTLISILVGDSEDGVYCTVMRRITTFPSTTDRI